MRTALAALLLLVCAATARAQQPAACTGAPKPPKRLASKVDAAIKATSRGHFTPAVLTLGWKPPDADPDHPANAPGSYIIEAGSEHALADIAVAQTSGPELGFIAPMANGTYYVRVRSVNACGMSPPSDERKVRIKDSVEKGRPNPLVISNTVRTTIERLGDRAYARVMGQVRNGWQAAPAPFVTVTASFDGAKDELGVRQTAYVNGTSRRLARSRLVTDTVIEPGASGCFLMFAEFPPTEVTGVKALAAADDFETLPLEGRVELDDLKLKPDDFDDLRAAGRLKNTGSRLTRFNEIWLEPRDAAGEVLDCRAAPVHGSTLTLDGITTRTGLEPAQSGEFESDTEAVFAMARTLRHWITWDETDDQKAPAATPPKYRELRERLIALVESDDQSTSPQERAQARDALRAEARLIEQELARASRR